MNFFSYLCIAADRRHPLSRTGKNFNPKGLKLSLIMVALLGNCFGASLFYDMEVWKAVEGCEGRYEVSSLGRVKSVERYIHRACNGTPYKFLLRERIRIPVVDRGGYSHLELSTSDKKRHFLVHRLVAAAFIPNPEGKPIVNHINGIKTDNRIENLEWATCSENQQHAYNTGLRVMPKGARHPQSIPISQFTKEGVFIRNWAGAKEAERETGFHQGNISACVRGSYKTAHGFVWRASNEF